MSQPYEFFPGSTPEPATAFGQPASPYAAGIASVASPLTAPARPGTVSMLAGLLVAQAALAAAPALTLLLLRDVIGTAMGALTSGFGAGELTGAEVTSGASGAGRLALWGVALLLVTVLSALSAVAVLDRRVWALVAAGLTDVGVLIWGLAHFSSFATVSTVAVLLAVAIGGLLAAPDVRRWCLSG